MVLYSRELALKRLQKLSLPYSSADSVLSLIPKSLSKGHTEEETLEKALQYLDFFLSDYHNSVQIMAPIFELSLKGLKLHHYKLTYDHRSSLQIKDLLLSDHARFPVFHVEFKDKEEIIRDSLNTAVPNRMGSRKTSKRNMNKRASVRFIGGQNTSTYYTFFPSLNSFSAFLCICDGANY